MGSRVRVIVELTIILVVVPVILEQSDLNAVKKTDKLKDKFVTNFELKNVVK